MATIFESRLIDSQKSRHVTRIQHAWHERNREPSGQPVETIGSI